MLGQRQKILIVDDDYIIRDFCHEFLTQNGYNVTVVCDGAEAIERLKLYVYDIIISDINMPRINGIELFRRLEKEYPFLVDRFLFITGNMPEDTESSEILSRMPERIIQKPFRPNGFLETIRSFSKPGVADALCSTRFNRRTEERFPWVSDCHVYTKGSTGPVPAKTMDVSSTGMKIRYGAGESMNPGTDVEVSILSKNINRPAKIMWSDILEEYRLSGLKLKSPLPIESILNPLKP
jgi:CheY-like chemotaxis protein